MSDILATILSIDIGINTTEFASNKNTGKCLLQIDGYIFCKSALPDLQIVHKICSSLRKLSQESFLGRDFKICKKLIEASHAISKTMSLIFLESLKSLRYLIL